MVLRSTQVETLLGPAIQISILIEDLATPEDFDRAVQKLTFKIPAPGWGVILEGRAPIWGYGMLVHECHPSSWVACFDPRLGAVVVETHDPKVSRGTVFDFTPEAIAS